MPWTPQNFVTKVGPTISAVWLNAIDTFWGLFGAPTTFVGFIGSLFPTIYQFINPRTAAEIAGFVTPTNYAWPQCDVRRYGAVGNGVTDDSAAIQNAITVAQIAFDYVLLIPGAFHVLATGLTFRQGKGVSDTQTYWPLMHGRNAVLLPKPGITAITITPRCLLANVGTGAAIALLNLTDFTIDGGGASASGITIGAFGFRWDAFAWSAIENVTIENMVDTVLNPGLFLVEGRHCNFYNVTCRGVRTYIYSHTNTAFAGDFDFVGCEFSGSTAHPPITINVDTAGAQARGIKFSDCDIYGGGTLLSCSVANAEVGDIWFNDCQFDVAAGTDIFFSILANGTGATCVIAGVHIQECYFVNGVQAINVENDNGAFTDQIIISNCQIGQLTLSSAPASSAIHLFSTNGISIQGCMFDGMTSSGGTTAYILAQNTTQLTVANNRGVNGTSITYGIDIFGTSNHYSFIGNEFSAGTQVIDTAGGANQQKCLNMAPPTVTGSRSANAALASLITQLASQGIIIDGSTP